MTSRATPADQLDYVTTEIVHCDDEFCPDLKDMMMDALLIAAEIKEPKLEAELRQCQTTYSQSDPRCDRLFMQLISKVNPWVFELVQKKRQSISPDPLQGYDGIKFGSPFWYEGAGDIWRRVSHGSKLVSVKDCERVRNVAEECLRNPANANDYCYRLYGHSLVCEAGVNCPYLRFDFIRCLQEHHLTDFAAVRNCVENVPQYKPCTKGYVKQAKKSV